MFVLFIVSCVLAFIVVTGVIVYNLKENEVGEAVMYGIIAIIFALAALALPFFGTFRWQIGSDIYTGYVYSRDSVFGYTKYHIRFSQNAGEDKQPSFSVKSGSEEEKILDDILGTDKKVIIEKNANQPFFTNNLFEPASTGKIKEIIGE